LARKALILATFLLVLAAETTCFGRQLVAGAFRLHGFHAFLRNDLQGSWRAYERALAWGGDRQRLEVDEIELLLFGLDQLEAGVKTPPPLTPPASTARAFELLHRRLRASPFKAYYWSLAADVYLAEARRLRRATPIDLATLSEDPLENLTSDEWRGIAALDLAGRLEPNNYLYQDLLVELFLGIGSTSRAATHCRRAVAAFSIFGEHKYLARPDLDPALLEAAVEGFEDASRRESMVAPAVVWSDAGYLLAFHGRPERAIPYLERAVRIAPDLYEAQTELGLILLGMGRYQEAIGRMREAGRFHPEAPDPDYQIGRAYLALGDPKSAVDAFRTCRVKDPRDPKYLYSLGEALEKAGQAPEAEREFVAAANLDPDHVYGRTMLLGFYQRRRDAKGIVRTCAELLALKDHLEVYRERCASAGLETR